MRSTLPFVVRSIAAVEAAKGTLALLAGYGLLTVDRGDVSNVAARLISVCHLDPASRYPRMFLETAGTASDTDLTVLTGLVLVYAAIRAIEAYWLWNARPWAEWFALGSACFYLPVEFYELSREVSGLMLGTLAVNLAIIAYLAAVLRDGAAWPRFFSAAKLTRPRALAESMPLA